MKGFYVQLLAAMSMFLVFNIQAQTHKSQNPIDPPQTKFDGLSIKSKTLDEQFSAYRLFTLDYDHLKKQAEGGISQYAFSFDGRPVIEFQLDPYDVRSDDYQLRVQNEDGPEILPRNESVTYRGYTKNENRVVRLNIADDFISGYIKTKKGTMFIESAHHFLSSYKGDPNVVITYMDKDMIDHEVGTCATGHNHGSHHPKFQQQMPVPQRNALACLQVEVALAADFDMIAEHGGTVAGVEAHVNAVINLVETNYDNDFDDDLEFLVTEVFVSNCASCDPWPSTNNIETVLDDFTDWGPTGFSNSHDVATLWSPRNFTHPDVGSGVIGLAWVGAVCSPFRYNVCEDFSNNNNALRALQSHEMGHNFDADHDSQGSQTIMAPSLVVTNNWSGTSINSISNHISTRTCLGPCGSGVAPSASFVVDEDRGCAPFTVQFNNQSSNDPTTFNWTFDGGTPSTSTQANPSVTYNNPGLFSVTLEVSNAFGSDESVMTDFIEVLESPIAEFIFLENGLKVNFTNLSENFETVNWDFGDGFSSDEINPVHTYEEDGTYTVVLTIMSECGSVTFTDVVELITAPSAGFSFDQNEGCAPFTVQYFQESSNNVDAFSWTFEGGTPAFSNAADPVVVYELPGEYDVSLIVTNDAGDDELVQTNAITVLAAPEADFDFEVIGMTVNLSATLGANDFFTWDLGDGNMSTQPSLSHTYDDGGTYTVILTTQNDCGEAMLTQTITINSAPSASIGANMTSGCAPLTIQFESTSTGSPTSYNWLFPGGSPATSTEANPTVSYATAGSYSVTLSVTNTIGSDETTMSNFVIVAPSTEADFSFSGNDQTVNFTNLSQNGEDYEWLFGDGSSSVDFSPSYTYNDDGSYVVQLIVNGPCGPDTTEQTILISTLPTAGFSANATAGCGPLQVQFTNASSTNASTFMWEFPGGSPVTSTEQNPIVTYATAGTYNVKLTATSAAGSNVLEEMSFVTVLPDPKAEFGISDINNLDVIFSNQSENANQYSWDFGDGNGSNAANPQHTYGALGTYTVTLTVTGDCGEDIFTQTIELSAQPLAQFGAGSQTGCIPFTVQFEDQSLNNPNSWAWTFPGGTPSTSIEKDPLVVYNTPGVYDVQLIVSNDAGNSTEFSENFVVVGDAPSSNFNFETNGLEVNFDDNSMGVDSWAWDFGDGQTSNLENPTITFAGPGEYEVALTVTNPCGMSTTTQTVVIMSTSVFGPDNSAGLKLFPNPVSEMLIVESEIGALNNDMQIVDPLGRIVWSNKSLIASTTFVDRLQINVSEWQGGVYFLIVKGKQTRVPFVVIR